MHGCRRSPKAIQHPIASCEQVDRPDTDGQLPEHIAAKRGHKAVLAQLRAAREAAQLPQLAGGIEREKERQEEVGNVTSTVYNNFKSFSQQNQRRDT